MKAKKFSEALGNVRDEYVSEAIAYQHRRKSRNWSTWGTMAACICLLVAGSFLYRLFISANFKSTANKHPMEIEMNMTTISIDEQIAHYQQVNIQGNELKNHVGKEYLNAGSMVWYLPKETDNLKYLIRKEADETLTLWMFTSFETGEGETYTYGDVLAIIYGVDSADDIVSITTTPIKGNNTSYGMQIQKKIGTQTYSDSDDILSFYNIVKDVACYGVSEHNPADPTRFTYSFSTDESDKLATGESTYGTRCISIEFVDGTILDSWKYSALSGSFFEYDNIFTEPLEESSVYVLNDIFGIK